MILDEIRTIDDSHIECEVRFEAGAREVHRIFVSGEHTPLAPDPSGFLLGAWLPAWSAGERRVRVEGPVCPQLAANLQIASTIIQRWFADLGPAPVIEAPHDYRPPATEAAAFLSGGVNSLAMIRTLTSSRPAGHPDHPTALVVVDYQHVGDIPRQETDARFAASMAINAEICRDLGLDAIGIRSNFCRLNTSMSFWMHRYHGTFLASMAHFLGRRFRMFHIASSYPATHLAPWGSHPLLDPLYSSQHVRISHEGVELSRLGKIAQLRDWPLALDRMYVCTSRSSDGRNCGTCDKCVRTKLHLLVEGLLPRAGAFAENDVSARDIEGITIGSEYARLCYEESVPGLQRLGRTDLVDAVRKAVRDYHERKSPTVIGSTRKLIRRAALKAKRSVALRGPLPVLASRRQTRLELRWIRRSGWLGAHLAERIPPAPDNAKIQRVVRATDRLGPQRLAPEYGEPGGTRTPDVVRSSSACGNLYAWLVQQRRPSIVVEFGAAFGVSGMYFCSGLEAAAHGHLYSFEINEAWADIAEANIASISKRFTLTRGAFEECVASVVPGPIDLAFVDGIHTYEFVRRQHEILRARSSRGALIAFDDIDFKRPGARMREAWEEIARDECVAAAVEVNGRVGLIELV